MKDIKSFCKLFDLNVPNFNEFDYYINQYKKLWRWKDMDDLISLYESAESQIEDIFKYKIDKYFLPSTKVKFLLVGKSGIKLSSFNSL